MDIKNFSEILYDKHFPDYEKLKYKYEKNFNEFLQSLDRFLCCELPLSDFDGKNIVFIDNFIKINQHTIKLLMKPRTGDYGLNAAEEEILSSSSIECIDFSRDSVRKILKGMAPDDEQETRILGIKHGLDFISDTANKITEENLYKLYMMTVGKFLKDSDKLSENNIYRHDTVYIVSDRVEHSGLDHKKVPVFMKNLLDFINRDDDINDLVKAAIIHFYIAYVHPYFDGNGRIARLVHLWFLIQKGYESALFVPFSAQIKKSRKAYYDAFTIIEKNKKYSNKIDVTPFILYFTENVYNKIDHENTMLDCMTKFDNAFKKGLVTEKETKLWSFVLSYYGTQEFSTKQLEKDYGDAAYATIRSFVLKFENLDIFSSTKYGSRIKYKIKEN